MDADLPDGVDTLKAALLLAHAELAQVMAEAAAAQVENPATWR